MSRHSGFPIPSLPILPLRLAQASALVLAAALAGCATQPIGSTTGARGGGTGAEARAGTAGSEAGRTGGGTGAAVSSSCTAAGQLL